MENNYYDGDKAGVATSSYLKDGFTYASYGLTITNKVGTYDQFILDENLNVVMSLTGNYGITIKDQKKEKVGYLDLIMQCVDGYYYNPLLPSEFNVYEQGRQPHRTQRRNEHQATRAFKQYLRGCGQRSRRYVVEPRQLYGAFNINGDVVIPFKYYTLSAFRGS